MSYVVALVAELLETPAKELEPHLRPNPRECVRDARRELRGRRAELARLREIPAGGVGPYR